jgi:excisionase family DNA binding protein
MQELPRRAAAISMKGHGMKYSYLDQQSPSIGTKEAAHILDCSEKHVRDMCKRGDIKAVKLGKLWHINRADLYERLGIEGGM